MGALFDHCKSLGIQVRPMVTMNPRTNRLVDQVNCITKKSMRRLLSI